jgi:quercetin dioxygenase-like cupin family protein
MSHLAAILRTATLAAFLATPSLAQETVPIPVDPMPPVTRSVLQTLDIADSGWAATLVLVDIAPNVAVGRHTHPGDVSAYVIYGSLEVEIDGEVPRRFAAGESFTVPANTIHDERTGAAGARIVASFVVPADAPLSTPVN